MQKNLQRFDDSWKRNLYVAKRFAAGVYATYTFFARLNTQNIRFGLHVTICRGLHYEQTGRFYGLARLCCL